MAYNIIDLFAGAGGLGEGFHALDNGQKFRIALSVEMDDSAYKTLLLRTFFRIACREKDEKAKRLYYSWCNGETAISPLETSSNILILAKKEAIQATLGEISDDKKIDKIIRSAHLNSSETVVIGGPPCQAYSLVGRSRNLGNSEYVPEKDDRHFLYREYLRIVRDAQPAVFVLENVKGILTSQISGKRIFSEILKDLSAPGLALGDNSKLRYSIRSLVLPIDEAYDIDMRLPEPRSFIVRSEHFGVPQARHRVILLGIRNDIKINSDILLHPATSPSAIDVLHDLPRLRSRLSRDDSNEAWEKAIRDGTLKIAKNAEKTDSPAISEGLMNCLTKLNGSLTTGSLRIPYDRRKKPCDALNGWYNDNRLKVHLNHEARSHMQGDLLRYFYSAAFAQVYGRSPKGAKDFSFPGLRPNHSNWESGKFADRFRVQMPSRPSSTITSHISKDGHYFIHWDPAQCRSLTVRESARLQTFPDNFFFQGNRTQQYHQVGNAVPPFLAYKIALVVASILDNHA